ncbi:hypothetical protein DEU56DRAFT_835979 [Suillus clintonianus]|uniref:uncharacterized protein n=1 Tax=Suillus clintonianus TaxID=1904413 RepID=UPI001B85F138|nr:uncharacterized protein DEU56DRAFT_835979 [Suillus clintonianus]KAG2120140.1 hypothetical protein DEU56DRAFT_835979 [Suillus clintonianus]
MVAKVFGGEAWENRTSESEILEKVKEIAKVNQSVEGHIPVLFCHEKFTNPTSSIREALGFLEPTKGSRVLYILVFPKLSPITKLRGDKLFNVWRQCILCHIDLWKGGVHHRDISPGNMMWYRDKLGKFMGVMNDYDLSSLASADGPQGNERTGTVPFMALDLLTARAQRGEVKHLYLHDMESFVWVFIWIFFRYNSEGDLLPPAARRFDAWATLGAFQCRKDKLTFLDVLEECSRPDVGNLTWCLLMECAWVLKEYRHHRSNQNFGQKLGRLIGAIDPSVDGLPGVVEQPEEVETEMDMDNFLVMFTKTMGWKALERRIRSQ